MTTEGSNLYSKEQVKSWLKNTVELEQYTKLFIDHGFESLNLVKEINNKNDLESMGITNFAHQLRIMNQINKLKQLNFENELELIYQPSAPLLNGQHHDEGNISHKAIDPHSKDDYADNQSNDLPKDEGDTSHKEIAQTSGDSCKQFVGRLCFAMINILAVVLWIIAILSDNLSVYSTKYPKYATYTCGWTQWSGSDPHGKYYAKDFEYAKCCNDENVVLMTVYGNDVWYGELTYGHGDNGRDNLSQDCCVTDTVAKLTRTTLILAISSSLFSLLFLQKIILKKFVIKCYFCPCMLTGLSLIFSLTSIIIWFEGNKICDNEYVADEHSEGFHAGGTMIMTIIATSLISVGEGIAVLVLIVRAIDSTFTVK